MSGHYVIVYIRSHIQDERTNVGAMIFDDDGKQVSACMGSLERAYGRGDIDKEGVARLKDVVYQYPKRYDNIDDVLASLESDGHAMSTIQITKPRSTKIYDGVLDDICKSFGINSKVYWDQLLNFKNA